MMIMTDNVVDVADLFSEFSLGDIDDILTEQLSDDRVGEAFEKDNFLPVYAAYKAALANPEIDEELKKQAKLRYYEISKLFVDRIMEKFELRYDPTIAEYGYDLGTLAFFTYRFFVLDLFDNTVDVLKSFVEDNADTIATVFEDYKGKKDAATISSKNYVPEKYIVVAANIPKVLRWVFEQLNVDTYFQYCNPEDVVVEHIKELFEDGKLGGNFIDRLLDLYVNDMDFRSKLILEVTFTIKFK